jgi:hypothetical protein
VPRSKDGLPKVKNDVNLPNLIARSKQKDKGQTERYLYMVLANGFYETKKRTGI